jgi:hypothetical protein
MDEGRTAKNWKNGMLEEQKSPENSEASAHYGIWIVQACEAPFM